MLNKTSIKFCGRQIEIGQLHDHFKEIYKQKKSETVIVCGEPGVGKTALLNQFFGLNKNIDYWHLIPSTNGGIIKSIVEFIFNKYDVNTILQYLSPLMIVCLNGYYPKLRKIAEQKFIELPERKPLESKIVLFETIKVLLETSIRKEKPAILWFDDFHLASILDVECLIYLMKEVNERGMNLHFIFCNQNQKLEQQHKSFLTQTKPSLRIELEPFTFGEFISFLNCEFSYTFSTLNQEFTKKLYANSRGNPLFIFQIIEQFKFNNILEYKKDKNWYLNDFENFNWPSQLTDSIQNRLDTLSKKSKAWDLLCYISLSENNLCFEDFTKLLMITKAEFKQILTDLSESKLITLDLKFTHPLLSMLVLENISKREKEKVNRLIIEYLKNKKRTTPVILAEYYRKINLSNQKEKLEAKEVFLKAWFKMKDNIGFISNLIEYLKQIIYLEVDESIKVDFKIRLANLQLINQIKKKEAISLLEKCVNEGNDEQKLTATILLFDRLFGIKENNYFEKFINNGLKIVKRINNPQLFGRFMLNYAYYLKVIGNFNKRKELMDNLMAIASKSKDLYWVQVVIYDQMSEDSSKEGDWQKTKQYAENALNICIKHPFKYLYHSLKGSAYEQLSYYELVHSNYPKAMELAEEALECYQKKGALREIAHGKELIGQILTFSGRNSEAIPKLEESVRILNRIGEHLELAKPLINLIDAYNKSGKFNKALSICKEYNSILIKYKDPYFYSVFLLIFGQTLTFCGFYSRAIQKINNGIEIAEKYEIDLNSGQGYYHLGNCYFHRTKPDYEKAYNSFNRAYEILFHNSDFAEMGADNDVMLIQSAFYLKNWDQVKLWQTVLKKRVKESKLNSLRYKLMNLCFIQKPNITKLNSKKEIMNSKNDSDIGWIFYYKTLLSDDDSEEFLNNLLSSILFFNRKGSSEPIWQLVQKTRKNILPIQYSPNINVKIELCLNLLNEININTLVASETVNPSNLLLQIAQRMYSNEISISNIFGGLLLEQRQSLLVQFLKDIFNNKTNLSSLLQKYFEDEVSKIGIDYCDLENLVKKQY
ncbi:MAG: AAA family ATPase [Candidatus Marinimicrobia bacterium]|nr:AAA family ATPase [Candidatus Neomarinimicrobiota bacterium]MBL7023346.1 AAA family ATPase [Candidatus Neomarinimicrobiota bacterium]MBL7109305.1 AAA family ATPase [Candidatus Neomarinimicrobiota bacterium]